MKPSISALVLCALPGLPAFSWWRRLPSPRAQPALETGWSDFPRSAELGAQFARGQPAEELEPSVGGKYTPLLKALGRRQVHTASEPAPTTIRVALHAHLVRLTVLTHYPRSQQPKLVSQNRRAMTLVRARACAPTRVLGSPYTTRCLKKPAKNSGLGVRARRLPRCCRGIAPTPAHSVMMSSRP